MPESGGTGPWQAEILLYQAEDGRPRIEVRFEGDTAWMTQAGLAELYQTSPQNITQLIAAIYAEGELDEGTTCKSNLQLRREGSRDVRRQLKHYSLPVVLAVGYRVRSGRGTQFRRWATGRLEEYVVKGFTMDDVRLKNPPGPGVPDYFGELLARIRDIRSSEKVFWRKVLEIYATSIDYDANADASQCFFATVQNKMHFAAHGHTAAEVIAERADADKPNMGLSSWAGAVPRKTDAAVAKNRQRRPGFARGRGGEGRRGIRPLREAAGRTAVTGGASLRGFGPGGEADRTWPGAREAGQEAQPTGRRVVGCLTSTISFG